MYFLSIDFEGEFIHAVFCFDLPITFFNLPDGDFFCDWVDRDIIRHLQGCIYAGSRIYPFFQLFAPLEMEHEFGMR